MICVQNIRSQSYHKIYLFLPCFFVDNVYNFVYKYVNPEKWWFQLWITFRRIDSFFLSCS